MQLTANAAAADREAVESAYHTSRRGAHRVEAITVQTAAETKAHICLDDADSGRAACFNDDLAPGPPKGGRRQSRGLAPRHTRAD